MSPTDHTLYRPYGRGWSGGNSRSRVGPFEPLAHASGHKRVVMISYVHVCILVFPADIVCRQVDLGSMRRA